MKAECPDFMSKVAPVKGDCLKPNLGISEIDRRSLQNEVNVVFHIAATVRFDAPLRDAVLMNIRCISDLLDMAKGMKDLHVCIPELAIKNPYWQQWPLKVC